MIALIKDNQKYFNRLHVIIDAIVVAVAYVLAWFLEFQSGLWTQNEDWGVLPPKTYFSLLYFIVPGYVFLYFFFFGISPAFFPPFFLFFFVEESPGDDSAGFVARSHRNCFQVENLCFFQKFIHLFKV